MTTDEIIGLLEERDGELHCPVTKCDVWFPEGMQYGFLDHYGEHDVCLRCEQELEHPGNQFICTECAASSD
ncbi:hypothetical protein [Natrinema versiforme]|uniref:Uncharacterized protein n=1 Tax=Natrinema versiforme TaxID=88724 RepID=A0A4P8WKS2_9EURY|nr:hypothetical protein [Natrinema versiforme]QCS43895.1 hypothetical protein FEJ81_16645 [Natrinema versiforme]